MSYEVSEPVRNRLLKYGALITGPAEVANATAVAAAATPILAWLEASASQGEFDRRCTALSIQYHNALTARWQGEAEDFIASAAVLRDWAAADNDTADSAIEAFVGPS